MSQSVSVRELMKCPFHLIFFPADVAHLLGVTQSGEQMLN